MDVEARGNLGRSALCPGSRTVLIALACYTLVICTIFYIVVAPISTRHIIQKSPPTAKTKPPKDDYIFSQAHPLEEVSVTHLSTTNKRMIIERPHVQHFYRSMKDFQPFNKSCSSCAIVSSSGQLLGKRAGKEIDNASCVLRMNTAPVIGFEEDVGARTTLRILCFIAVNSLKINGDDHLLGPRRPETALFWGLNQAKHKSSKAVAEGIFKKYMDSVDFYSQTYEGEDMASKIFANETGFAREQTNTWLSTGWFTIMLALDICREIRIYGMIPDEYCKSHQKEPTKYHYFQKEPKPTECGYYTSHEGSTKGGHRFITEKAVFARWAKKFNISFHHPEWDLTNVSLTKPLDTPFAQKQVVLEKAKQRKLIVRPKGRYTHKNRSKKQYAAKLQRASRPQKQKQQQQLQQQKEKPQQHQ